MYCQRNSAGARELGASRPSTVAETSSKAGVAEERGHASGSCIENTARTNPPSSGLMCSTMACSMSSNGGWMVPGVLTTTRPPGDQHAVHLGDALPAGPP